MKKNADSDRANYVFPTPALAAQLSKCADGTGLKSSGAAEPTRPGGHWGYRQGTFIADLGLPARTVTGSSSQDWVRWGGELRRLTLLEVMQLQGFPIDWKLCGSKADGFKQIGNAVPTVFGGLIGGLLRQFVELRSRKKAVPIGWPKEFDGYIRYTMSDEAKNGVARKVHLNFTGSRDSLAQAGRGGHRS